MPGPILDLVVHLNLIEHCIEQQAPHATSKPPTVGQ